MPSTTRKHHHQALLALSLILACDSNPAPPDGQATDSSSTGGASTGSSTSQASSSGEVPTSTASPEDGSSTTSGASTEGSTTEDPSTSDTGSSSGTGTDVCGPPSPSVAAPVSLDGADFDPADVVAIVTQLEDVATEGGTNPFRTELRIRLSQHPDACSREDEAVVREGEAHFQLLVYRNSDTAAPGLPEPGTYPLDGTLPMANDGTTYFRGAGVLSDCQDNCILCSGLIQDPSGSLTLTTVTPSTVSGSFEYTDSSGSYSGSFEAPICGSTDPDVESCCWSP